MKYKISNIELNGLATELKYANPCPNCDTTVDEDTGTCPNCSEPTPR